MKTLLLFCCISTLAAGAQTLATVSFNAVVLQTTEAQKSLASLQTKLAPRQDHLKTLSNEVDTLRKQLASNGGLNDAERTSRERSLESSERQLQREADDFKADTQTESEQIFQRVAQKVYAFLQTYSQQHGYTLVIERGSDTNPVVWYAAANTDITDAVLKAYNLQARDEAPSK